MDSAGERLKAARERAGFNTIAEAARRFRWHKQNVADHEANRRGIDAEQAQAYGAAYRVSPWWLLSGKVDLLPVPDFGNAPAVPASDEFIKIIRLFNAIRDRVKERSLQISDEEALLGALWAVSQPNEKGLEPDYSLIQEAITYIYDAGRRTSRISQ